MFIRYKSDVKDFHTSKNKKVTNIVQIYNVPRELITYISEIGKLVGFGNRSKIIKFIIKQYYDKYKYLIDPNNTVYIFIDYDTNSYASNDLLDILDKYNLEVLTIRKNKKINRMVLSSNTAFDDLHQILSKIVTIDGILLMKFVGV